MALTGRIDAGTYSFAAGFEAGCAAVAARPDAIFFANDILALGGRDCLRCELGFRIPKDLSVVGFDDIRMSAWSSYGLTTIRQPIAEMVRLAVAMIEGTGIRESAALPGELIERTSVAARS